MAEKFPTQTRPVIAKNALAVSFLAPRVHMQVDEIHLTKNNLALNFQLIKLESIETALGSAPESGRFSTTHGSYSVGYVSFADAIIAGGSGSVNETDFFGGWNHTGDITVYRFMLFHDIFWGQALHKIRATF